MICRNCNNLMKSVMRFDGVKAESFFRCRACFSETKRTPLFFNPTRNDNKNLTERGKRK